MKNPARIRQLDDLVANQIAAGEVIERPASIVKELVENSLDAGANQIDIYIKMGGTELIEIRDNGSGIHPQDIKLALIRHATSKIAAASDLNEIDTLGFRGEALPSIASISLFELTSKAAGQDTASAIKSEGPNIVATDLPAAHPQGTTVKVRQIFYNVPARRKFLRSETTELRHIKEIVKRIALVRFDVTFRFYHNDKLIWRLPAFGESIEDKTKRLQLLFNKKVTQFSSWIEQASTQFSLSGWLIFSQYSAISQQLQLIYINQRPVQDTIVRHAVKEAVVQAQASFAQNDANHSLDTLNANLQPQYILYLEIPCNQLDVNVHPAKSEVRFHQPRMVHDFILSACSRHLQGSNQFSADKTSEPAHQVKYYDPPPNLQLTTNELIREKTQSNYNSPNQNSALSGDAGIDQESSARLRQQKSPNFKDIEQKTVVTSSHGEVNFDTGFEQEIAANESAQTQEKTTEQIIVADRYLFHTIHNRVLMTDLVAFWLDICRKDKLQLSLGDADAVERRKLLMPARILIDPALSTFLQEIVDALYRIGFEFKIVEDKLLILLTIPEIEDGLYLKMHEVLLLAAIYQVTDMENLHMMEHFVNLNLANIIKKRKLWLNRVDFKNGLSRTGRIRSEDNDNKWVVELDASNCAKIFSR